MCMEEMPTPVHLNFVQLTDSQVQHCPYRLPRTHRTFCIWSDNQLCWNPTPSSQASPVDKDFRLRNFQRERCTHPPITFPCRLSFHCCCYSAAPAVSGLRHFEMLPAPLWLSLLFGGCVCHFGLVFQIPFFKWRWCRRKWQRRTAAAATSFPVVT